MPISRMRETAGARETRAPADGRQDGVAVFLLIGLGSCYIPLLSLGLERGAALAMLGGASSGVLTFAYLAYRRTHAGRAWADLGFVPPTSVDALLGVAAGALTLALDMLRARLFPDPLLLESNKLPAEFTGLAAFAALCVMLVGAAFAEECVFRAYLIPALTARRGRAFALLASSALFGLLHFPYVAAKTISGLILGGLFIRRGSIWPALIAHILHNLAGYAVSFFLLERAAAR